MEGWGRKMNSGERNEEGYGTRYLSSMALKEL